MIIFDIGSNTLNFTQACLSEYAQDTKIVVVEPNKECFESLYEENRDLNIKQLAPSQKRIKTLTSACKTAYLRCRKILWQDQGSLRAIASSLARTLNFYKSKVEKRGIWAVLTH